MKKQNSPEIDKKELESVCSNICSLRKQKGLSQAELGQRMGVTQRVVSYYENEARNITLEAITAIAKALGVSRSKLLELNSPDYTPSYSLPKSLQKKIDLLSRISPKGQKMIGEMIDMLAQSEEIE